MEGVRKCVSCGNIIEGTDECSFCNTDSDVICTSECPSCGKVIDIEGGMCPNCDFELSNENCEQEDAEDLNSICINCSNPTEPGNELCKSCLQNED